MITSQELAGYSADTGTSSVSVIPMRREHVDSVVDVHLVSFPGFFLTFLGPKFLRLLYSEIIDSPDHLALVAQDERGVLVGFVVGTACQRDFYARLAQQRRFGFAAVALGNAIRHPRIIPRLFRALRYPRTSEKAETQALLMSLGVTPEMWHQGIGRRLGTAFLEHMKKRNVPDLSLATDRDANQRANRFYQQLGFRVARVYVTPEGRWMNEYVIDLSRWSPSSNGSGNDSESKPCLPTDGFGESRSGEHLEH